MLVQLQRCILSRSYGATCCRNRCSFLRELVDVVGIRQYACISIFLIRRIIAGKLRSESRFALSRRPILTVINTALIQRALTRRAVILNIANKLANRSRRQSFSNFSVAGKIFFTVLIACIVQLISQCIQCVINNILIGEIHTATISQKRDARPAGCSTNRNIPAINLGYVISSMSHDHRCITVIILDIQIPGCAVSHINGRSTTCCGCQRKQGHSTCGRIKVSNNAIALKLPNAVSLQVQGKVIAAVATTPAGIII